MDEQLEYAEMLEIPVSTVNVVKKRSLFGKRKEEKNLKEEAISAVNERVSAAERATFNRKVTNAKTASGECNQGIEGTTPATERMGDYVYAEDLSDYSQMPQYATENPFEQNGNIDAQNATLSAQNGNAKGAKSNKARAVLISETVAICLLAVGIFVTNLLMPTSAINTFIGYFTATTEPEAVYSDFTLYPVVSELSTANISVSDSGVISFKADCAVYPVCNGTVASIYQNEGIYTVEIAHTSTFSSVITGVNTVYYSVGESVKSEVPVARSNGETEVKISMFNNGTLLNCYVLSGTAPVWNL
jgi:hypothetical protein